MSYRASTSPRRAAPDGGMTLIELLIVSAIIGILAAIAIPRMVRVRTTANEAAAIASMRAIATAEEMYARTCGNGGFAVALPTLGADDCNGTTTQSAFYATAVPATLLISGTRAFAVNAGQTIWELPGSTAPSEPFGAPATPLR